MVAVGAGRREVRTDDITRAVEAARAVSIPSDREILHVLPRQFTVDGQEGVREAIGMAGTRLEVETHVVTGASTFIENVGKCVRRAHLTVEDIVLEPLAAGLSVLSAAERALGVALVDIGGGTTDVALFADGSLYHSAVIPVGGNHVSYDLSVGLRLGRAEAEDLKIRHGCALIDQVGEDEYIDVRRLEEEESRELPRRVVAEIIEPRMREVFELVAREHERALP